MFETLRRFLTDHAGHHPAAAFSDDDYRVAAAALFVHVLSLDGRPSEAEMTRLKALLEYRFALSTQQTETLITEAQTLESDAIDVAPLAARIRHIVNHSGRLRIIEMMWEMVYADGRMTEVEDSSVWRTADLLGVSAEQRQALRQRAARDMQQRTEGKQKLAAGIGTAPRQGRR